jgi:hypothetical protein
MSNSDVRKSKSETAREKFFAARRGPGGPAPKTFEQRVAEFWALVDRSDENGCWPYRGHCDGDGYGRHSVRIGNRLRPYPAHRFAWEITNGPVADDLVIRHLLCNNPPCCNPAHLAPGTFQDNSDDALRAGHVPFGENSPTAKLTNSQVLDAIRRRQAGDPVKEIAASLGVTKECIYKACSGEWWSKVTGIQHVPGKTCGTCGKRGHNSRTCARRNGGELKAKEAA